MKGVINMSFGKILKELRTERKVTQQELSDYLNISKSMISMNLIKENLAMKC